MFFSSSITSSFHLGKIIIRLFQIHVHFSFKVRLKLIKQIQIQVNDVPSTILVKNNIKTHQKEHLEMFGNNHKGLECAEQHVMFNTSRHGEDWLAGRATQDREPRKWVFPPRNSLQKHPKMPILIPIDPKSLYKHHQHITQV